MVTNFHHVRQVRSCLGPGCYRFESHRVDAPSFFDLQQLWNLLFRLPCFWGKVKPSLRNRGIVTVHVLKSKYFTSKFAKNIHTMDCKQETENRLSWAVTCDMNGSIGAFNGEIILYSRSMCERSMLTSFEKKMRKYHQNVIRTLTKTIFKSCLKVTNNVILWWFSWVIL